MDIDDQMIGRFLTRREVLALMGSAGAALLVGCSGSDDDDATGTSSQGADTQATSASTATPTIEPAETEPTDPTATGNTTATNTAEAAGSAATSAQIDPTALAACVVAPELTEGPYYVDIDFERSDIRSDPSTGTVVDGTTLELVLRTLQVGGDGCAPLAGAAVDIWHCDANGVYSDSQDPGFDTTGQFFLRGYQVSDDNGVVRFTTIYPGWYQGRAVHIHFKVQGDAGSGQSYEFTSQFFFDESLTDVVQAEAPYAAKGYRTTLNEDDMIYRDGGSALMLEVSQNESGDGYIATFDIGIQLA
jgi:protocatechuate 3,4-dioxygenase beta subunit